MRKKHEHSTRASETITPSLSEKALLNLGHYHHGTEDYLVRLAQDEGNPDLVASYAERLSGLLADTAVRAMAGDPALVPHMRQNGFAVDQRGRHSLRHVDQSAKKFHDRPSGTRTRTRTLSKKARKAISDAQHERWARVHARQERQRKYSRETKRRQRAGIATPGKASSNQRSGGMKGYWGKMTPEERSLEIVRRRKVTVQKKAGAA